MSKSDSEATPLTKSSSLYTTLRTQIRPLLFAPRELWLTFLAGFILNYAMITLLTVLVLTVSDRFHTSDTEAGLSVALVGLGYGVFAVLEGSMPDKLGVRFTLIYGCMVLAVFRVIGALAQQKWLLYVSVLLFMPIGGGVCIPCAKYSVKKCTTPSQRVSAYTLLYISIEIGGIAASILIDLEKSFDLTVGNLSVYQVLLIQSAIGSVLTAVVAVFMRDIEFESSGEEEIAHPENIGYWTLFRHAVSRRQFRLVAVTILLLIFARSATQQAYFTIPKYMMREIGPDAHFGLVQAIRPLILAISAVFSTPLVKYFSYFSLLILGSLISALSCLILLLGASYLTCALFIIGVSFGEGMWNPRMYDYVMALAPRGLEGPFVALMALPNFLSIFASGLASGVLLDEFCPEDGTRHCYVLWLVVAGIAALAPIGLIFLRTVLNPKPQFIEMPEK